MKIGITNGLPLYTYRKDSSGTYTSFPARGGTQCISKVSVNGDFSTPNNFSYHVHAWQNRIGTQIITNRYGTQYYLNGVHGTPVGYFAQPSFDSIIYNEALARMYDEVRGTIDLSIDAFQARQIKSTVDLLRKIVNNIALFYAKILRGAHLVHFTKRVATYYMQTVHTRKGTYQRRRRKVVTVRTVDQRGTAKRLAEMWLTFQYGIRPTAQTAYDTLKRVLEEPNLALRVKGKSAWSNSTRSTINSPMDSKVKEQIYEEERYNSRILCEFVLKPSILSKMAGYTSLNPASIAWELFPFSFVLDWAWQFGGYLRSFENALLHGVAFKRGYSSEVAMGTTYKSVADQYTYSINTYTYLFDASARSLRFRRAVLGGSPFPRPPRFRLKLGLERTLSAISLLTVQFKTIR